MRDAVLPPVLDRLVFGRTYQQLARGVAAFGALLLPSSCVLCGAWDTSLCDGCLAVFRRATARPFRADDGAESLPDVEPGAPGEDGHLLPGPGYGPLPVLAAGRYGRAVSVVLLAYKNHGHVDLAAPVAAALAGVLHEAARAFRAAAPAGARPVLVVPVPTRASSRRRRGYDPLMLLLSRLDRAGHLPASAVLTPCLRQVPQLARFAATVGQGGIPSLPEALAGVRSAWGGGQKGLGRRRRRANVLHSMELPARRSGALAGRDCIIVDDVLTTGATIGEVHRVLMLHGARVLGAAVIAATSSPIGTAARGAQVPPAPPPMVSRGGTVKPPQVSEHQGMNNGQS